MTTSFAHSAPLRIDNRPVERWFGPRGGEMVVAESDSGQLCEMPRATFAECYDGMGWHLYAVLDSAVVPAPRNEPAPDLTVEQQLDKLGVTVHHVTYGPNHKFGTCEWCNELDSLGSCNVYPRDGWFYECCTNCVVSVADHAVTESAGRSDYCTVEMGTVETPAPVAVIEAVRDHDLAALLPLPCDTCAPARGVTAQFELTFDVIHHGETEGIRWHLCGGCLPSCMVAASTQNRGFTPPILTVLPTRIAVAA